MPKAVGRFALLVFIALGEAMPAFAQEQPPEIFAGVELAKPFAGDLRYRAMAAFGGEIVLSAGRVRIAFGGESGRSTRMVPSLKLRQASIAASAIKEFHATDRMRAFVGAGAAWLFQHVQGATDDGAAYSERRHPVALYLRAGVVGSLTRRTRLRAEAAYAAQHVVDPALGVRFAVGYAF